MAGIFLQAGDAFVPMRETAYDTEAVLQELIAKHPQMLSGDDEDGTATGTWLLVRREASVYDEDDAASRGSLDHLFLDGDGVPTLVEVKRASDTRIRREVVGQLLDYAANAGHWTVDKLAGWLDARCRSDGLEADAVLAAHTDDVDGFWESVRTNLAAGHLRLVGQTEAARQVKGKHRQVRHWDRASVLEDLRSKCPPAEVAVAERVCEWGDGRGLRCLYGHGTVDGSMQFGILDGSRRIFPFVVYTNGFVEIPFARMAAYEPFADEVLLAQFVDRLNAIDGIEFSAEAMAKRPSVRLELLAVGDRLNAFLGVADWAINQT